MTFKVVFTSIARFSLQHQKKKSKQIIITSSSCSDINTRLKEQKFGSPYTLPIHQPISAFPRGFPPVGTIHNHLQRRQIYIHQNHGAGRKRHVHRYSCYMQIASTTNEPNRNIVSTFIVALNKLIAPLQPKPVSCSDL